MPKTELTRHHADVNEAGAICVTAVYQRDGAVALIRSGSFSITAEIDELLSWAKDFEELGIEFIRLEVDPTKVREAAEL